MASGSAGESTASNFNFVDNTVGAFTDVAEGDFLHISGESGQFCVTTKTNDNSLDLDRNLSNTATGISWRAVQNPVDLDSIVFFGVDGSGSHQFRLLYDSINFTVTP